jgi:hypothetical protein
MSWAVVRGDCFNHAYPVSIGNQYFAGFECSCSLSYKSRYVGASTLAAIFSTIVRLCPKGLTCVNRIGMVLTNTRDLHPNNSKR